MLSYWLGFALEEWSASQTVPSLALLRFFCHTHTREMEPFKRTVFVIAPDHITIGNVVAKAKSRFGAYHCTSVGSCHIEHA